MLRSSAEQRGPYLVLQTGRDEGGDAGTEKAFSVLDNQIEGNTVKTASDHRISVPACDHTGSVFMETVTP